MNESERIAILQQIFHKVFDDDQIVLNAETERKDIDMWDSLTHVLMVNEVESRFNVKFQLQEIVEIHSVGDILSLLRMHA